MGSLTNGVRYRFSVRAKNSAGEGPGSATAEVTLLTVAYSASSYQATEGGAAVSVGVVLSPATDRSVSIPIRVTAASGTEGGDYTVGGLSGGRLSFTSGQSTRTFTITANVDGDGADETVSLGLGSLPSGVSAGTPASATVTLRDVVAVPDQPTGLTATAGNGQAALEWDDLNDDSVTEWQYRGDRYHPAKGRWTEFRGWTAISGSSAGTTSYTVTGLSNGVRYRFSVRAKNSAGEGPGSATAEVTPNPPLPDQPTGLTATAGNGQAALEWDDLDDDSVTEWQYRGDRYHPAKGRWTGFRNWTAISGSSAGTTRYTVTGLSNGVRYRFSVRAAPNPFNPHTTIQFHLPARGVVSLVLYNLRGQVVRTIAQERSLAAGQHTLVWDGRDAQGRSVASGMYLYRLTVGKQALVKKITLLK